MYFIDTHAHLYINHFDDDREATVQRAIAAGVKKIICPNIDLGTIEQMLDLTTKFPDVCYPLLGIHPSSIKENFEKDLAKLDELFGKNKYYGIGEVGIDLYWDKTYKAQQIEAFTYQVKFAKKHKLPVIIHARNAMNEVLSVLDKEMDDNLTGILHSFDGNIEQAKHITEYGTFWLGIGGILTYKKSSLPEVIKQIDLQHIVLETDSPFLPPVPKRGKRNESAFVVYTAQKLAEIKNISIAQIANTTTQNAIKIFNLTL